MRLAVSHTFFNKKLDEYGEGHDESIRQIIKLEKAELQKCFPIPENCVVEEDIDPDVGNCSMSEASKAIHAKRLSLIKDIPESDLEIDFSVPVLKMCIRKFPSV